jgi:hypothetical protein
MCVRAGPPDSRPYSLNEALTSSYANRNKQASPVLPTEEASRHPSHAFPGDADLN